MDQENTQNLQIPRFIPSTRLLIALLVSFALLTQYAQRQSLSIAIVCMINKTNVEMAAEFTPYLVWIENETTVVESVQPRTQIFKEKTFHWNELEQQIMLGAYWAGYILTLVPGIDLKI